MKKLNIVRLFGLLLLVAVALSPFRLTLAQDGLAEDETELLNTAMTAIARTQGYGSYVETEVTEEVRAFTVNEDGEAIGSASTSTTTQSVQSITRGSDPNATYSIVINTVEGDATTSIQGELRYIDGTLYAAALFLEGGDATTFPDVWSILNDPNEPGPYAVLNPADFVLAVLGEEESPFENAELISSVVTSVTVTEGTLNDETPVNIITMTVGPEDMLELLGGGGLGAADEQTLALLPFMSNESGAILTVFLDMDGTPVRSEVVLSILISDVPLNQVDPAQPEERTITVEITNSQAATLTSVNEELTPIAAP